MPERKKAYDLAVILTTPHWREPTDSVVSCVERVLATTDKLDLKTQVIVTVHKRLGPTEELKTCLKKTFPPKNVTTLEVEGPYTYAYTYLKGLQQGADIAKVLVEMDSGGTHLPEEIPVLINGFNGGFDIVLSTRFTKGSINKFPLQRRLVSLGATILSDLFLETHLSDAASGFEAFNSEVIQDLFKAVPPEQWLSANLGPLHMYQTEMRALLSWQKKYPYTEIPISYGTERTGHNFPVSYILKSLRCFYHLWREKHKLQDKLNISFS